MNIFKVKGKMKVFPLIILTLAPLIGGAIIGYLTKDYTKAVFSTIQKPAFSPPAILFPIVWTILYLLMGFSLYRIYMHREVGENIGAAFFFFIIQLLLNYLWPLIFFSLRLYGLAFIELVILFIFVVITFVKFYRIDKLAGVLLIPYIIWLIFAGVLNFFLWMLNEM